MTVFVKRTAAVSCLLLVAGCVTDELVVYKDSVLSKEAMKPLLGLYQVDDWPGGSKPASVRVTEDDGEFRFSYSVSGNDVQLQFLLSKIPNSKKGLYLLSIPGQESTRQANMYFVGKTEKEETHVWAVFSNMAVAKDHLEMTGRKARAEDVRQFLEKHADEFVKENEPQITLKSEKN